MIIDFNRSNQIYAVKFPKTVFLILEIVFLLLTLIFFIFLLFPRPNPAPSDLTQDQLRGLMMINLAVSLFTSHLLLFYRLKLKHLKKPQDFDFEKINLADFLDFDSALVLWRAINGSAKHKRAVSAADLTYEILNNYKIKFIFDHLGLNYDLIKRHISSAKPQEFPDKTKFSQDFILTMKDTAKLLGKGQKQIELADLFIALIANDPVLKYLMTKFKITADDFTGAAKWFKFFYRTIRPLRFFEPEYLMKFKGIGKDWAYGYTFNLDKYSVDLSQKLKNKDLSHHIIGHNEEISSIERILAKRGENNVVLVGEPGTGRRTIILGFTYKINEGLTYENLAYKRVVELDMKTLASVGKSAMELNSRLNGILGEAMQAGNVIVIVDDFHNFLSGDLDIKQTVIPYLGSKKFQFIGVTDHKNYHQKIEFDPSLKVLMEKVEVKEPTADETIEILEDILINLENRHKVKVFFQSLREIVNMTDRLEPNRPFPEKAIGLLNEAVISAANQGLKKVAPDLVEKILSAKLGFEVGEAQKEEREKLLNLEKMLHQRVVNQERAIKVITEALQKSRAGLLTKKPIGAFLFLGPTGVGKTQTAKTLADVYFKNSQMIRLDLSEYQEADSVKRLLGEARQNIKSPFLNKVREKPFSVVLLDELEKAHKNTLNLFLTVLDEGYLTDDYGEKTSFLNSIVIATSNAASEFIRQKITAGADLKLIENELIDYIFKNNIFSPEFINRFDAVVVFTPLSQNHLVKVAAIILEELNKKLKEKRLEIQITEKLLEKLAQIGFDPVFGARALNRAVGEKIESFIAKGILEDKYKAGEKIVIDPESLVIGNE